MSSARDLELSTDLNRLLKRIIPDSLFRRIGEISTGNEPSELFIRGVENSALAKTLYNCLGLDKYPGCNSGIYPGIFGLGGYSIRSGSPAQLAETLGRLSPAEKEKLSDTITESFVKDSSARASRLVESLTHKIETNGLKSAAVAVEVN